jgi:hypothetical protein
LSYANFGFLGTKCQINTFKFVDRPRGKVAIQGPSSIAIYCSHLNSYQLTEWLGANVCFSVNLSKLGGQFVLKKNLDKSVFSVQFWLNLLSFGKHLPNVWPH